MGLTQDYASEYATWSMIWQRCINPNQKDYPYYGGRGITVCRRWEYFENFLEDMGPRPSPKHALVRRHSGLRFQPSNCSWEPRGEAVRRRRSNKLTFKDAERIRARYKKGAKRADLAREYGVSIQHVCMICEGSAWAKSSQ